MELPERIKTLRKEKNLTLEQVGDYVGVGKSTVRKWETGFIENMRRDKIAKLAKCFGVSPSYLMGWDNINNGINNGIIGNNNNHNVVSVGKEALGEIETELLSLCGKMSIQQKTKLLTYAYGLTEETNK